MVEIRVILMLLIQNSFGIKIGSTYFSEKSIGQHIREPRRAKLAIENKRSVSNSISPFESSYNLVHLINNQPKGYEMGS